MSFERIRIINYPFVRHFFHEPEHAVGCRFTDSAAWVLQETAQTALHWAILGKAPSLLVLEAVLGRWEKPGRLGCEVLKACGVDRRSLEADVHNELPLWNASRETELDLEQVCKVALLAESEAATLGRDYIGTEHLLLALLKIGDEKLDRLFGKHGVTYEECQVKLAQLMQA